MSLIHHNLCEGLHSGISLYSVPPTQTTLGKGQVVEINLLVALTPSAATEFILQGTSEEYGDLFNAFLHLRAKLTLSNDDQILTYVVMAPTNY